MTQRFARSLGMVAFAKLLSLPACARLATKKAGRRYGNLAEPQTAKQLPPFAFSLSSNGL
jgi:hypothetical protein